MALHLVTGYKGSAHVTSADQGLFNAGCVGFDDYVLNTGNRFDAQIVTNNDIKIYSGSLLMQGRHVILDSNYSVSISNGASSTNRNDLIVMRYTKDSSTGVESVNLTVIKGTATTGTATDPSYNTNSILNGELVHDMPLYRVVLEGLTVTKVEPLFQVLAPMADIQHGFYKQNMLINGDFQCNQRGAETYEATGSTQVKYSVDMWRIHQLKLEVLNEGVKISGNSTSGQGYLTQFIQLGRLETVTYTISAMVDGKICTFTVTPGGAAKEKDFGKFKISALTVSIWDNNLPDFNYYNNKLKINICPVGTNTITIKYVDVFKGTVAYPHVKEDPATALMRCRRYIQKGCYVSPVWYHSVASGSNQHTYKFSICHEKLDYTEHTQPRLESHTAGYVSASGETISNAFTSNLAPTSLEGMFTVTLVTGTSAIHPESHAIKGTYVVTSEHAPDGD